MRSRASGKVMIAGEYSVLFGGDSIVAAIDREASAEFLAGETLSFKSRTTAGFETHERHELFMACLSSAKSLGFSVAPGSYSIDTSAFYNSKTKHKIGIGSSAAAIVALCKLFLPTKHDSSLLLKLALSAHKDFSKSLGSGADIAASVYEKVLHYSLSGSKPNLETLDLPWLPQIIWVDTLKPQNTRDFVLKALDFAHKRDKFVSDFIVQSNNLVSQLRRQGDDLPLVFDELSSLLKEFGEQAGINIMSEEHKHIKALAYSLGGSAKPSGAGGGDLSCAWVPACKRESFFIKLSSMGFSVLPLSMSI